MNARWALFLSGRGSTAQAILDYAKILDIRLVVSSKKQTEGLAKARRAGLAQIVFDSKTMNWQQLNELLHKNKVNKILLVGFMKILPEDFLKSWDKKIWNIHPSLLPLFKGKNAFQRSYESGGALGVSLHEVTSELDAGKVLYQKKLTRENCLEKTSLNLARCEQRLLRDFILTEVRS